MNHTLIVLPLIVGTGATICTIVTHGFVVLAVVQFVRHERDRGRVGASYRTNFTVITVAALLVLVAHLIEIALWATLFVVCGEFPDFATAFYHSAVNYTSLGYGDIVMSRNWRLLGPLEAADGMLMFGVSTAIVFAVIQRLVLTRFRDLRD